jgi:RNA polymerase sigma-70 factor (ECF subfamily)
MEELSSTCEAGFVDYRRLLLDLSGVQFVDADGVALLHNLSRRGAVFIGSSAFLKELLRNKEAEEHGGMERDQDQSSASEAQLLTRLRHRDDDAFEQLVRQYGARLLAAARRVLNNEQDAQDAVQEAFLSAFKALDQFTGMAKLSTWLHRIVINAALMKLRSRRRRPEASIEELLPRFDAQGEWETPVSHWNTPAEELLQQQQTRTLVRQSIDRLPETYRTVLLLRDIEELDTEEVANILGITANAVKIRLHRARQALMTLLTTVLPETPYATKSLL